MMDQSSRRRSTDSAVHSCDGAIDEADIIGNVEEKNDKENEQAETQQCDHDEVRWPEYAMQSNWIRGGQKNTQKN